MIRYRIAPRAQKDIDDIWDYVAKDSVAAADRLVDMFYQKFAMLASQPLLGEARSEVQRDLRAFVMDRYVALYRPQRDCIEIVRLVHSARDIGAML